jgi:ParB family chromosome partitioning protein
MLEQISKIKVKKRIREDLGDLESLKQSLRHFGLMNPIIINTKRELVAGHRRLEAAKQLGWKTISVIIIEKQQELEAVQWEIEENLQRKDFTQAEYAKAQKRLNQLRNPNIFVRIWRAIVQFFKRIFGSP